MKYNGKQIFKSLLGLLFGALISIFGIAIGGGGHGPFVEISIPIALVGIFIFGASLLVFIILIISSLFNKEVFSKNEQNLQSIPTYNWRCPKCDSVIKANTSECKQCNFNIIK